MEGLGEGRQIFGLPHFGIMIHRINKGIKEIATQNVFNLNEKNKKLSTFKGKISTRARPGGIEPTGLTTFPLFPKCWFEKRKNY